MASRRTTTGPRFDIEAPRARLPCAPPCTFTTAQARSKDLAEALAVYEERVRGLVQAGGNPAYAEAAELVARMARLRGAAEQSAYIAELKTRFARRRNVVKLLES